MKRFLLFFSLLFSLSFYGQNDMLSVVHHTDKSYVIPNDLNVVYRGLSNELFVDVKNCKSFEVSGMGVTKTSNNIYNLNPGAGLEATLIVDIILKNNNKITEKHIFKIRNVPSQLASINYRKESVVKINKSQLNNAIINVYIPDKNLNLNFDVKGFKIRLQNGKVIEVFGDKINTKTFEQINRNLLRNDKILIYDIQYRSKSNSGIHFCKINEVVIEIL